MVLFRKIGYNLGMNSENKPLNRIFSPKIPKGKTVFIWGARKTGKTSYLKKTYPDSKYFDLLNTELFIKYTEKPSLLREEILSLSPEELTKPIIIDEVQKVPLLLDEVHWLIENTKAYFILCGSSARKLKRGGANLLGGRAWGLNFFPLSFIELENFNLLTAFNRGLIPAHYLSEYSKLELKAYVENYLKEEIYAEGLVRNLSNFTRFLESVVYSNAEIVNYSNIGRDCGVDSKTVKEYYQILIDTLLGYYIYPLHKRNSRERLSLKPKFYLFDIGLSNYLARRTFEVIKGSEAGKIFEQFILMELMAYRSIKQKDFTLSFWKKQDSELEVDFVIDEAKIGIEVKISEQVDKDDYRGLLSYHREYPESRLILVSRDKSPRKVVIGDASIEVHPYQEFLKELWAEALF